jgi:hypothetical protein
MMEFLLAFLLAASGPGHGQTTAPPAEGVSQATVPVQNTDAAPESVAAPAPAKPAAVHLKRVHIHPEAAEWEPFSVKDAGESFKARTFFERRVRKMRKSGYKGEASASKAKARSYQVKDDRMLVVSVYPAVLRARRTHVEVRFLVVEGYLEEVKVAAVTVSGDREFAAADENEDSVSLRADGVDFIEIYPSAAEVQVLALDPGPGRSAYNAGAVRLSAFGETDMGFVNFGWSLRGVEAGP